MFVNLPGWLVNGGGIPPVVSPAPASLIAAVVVLAVLTLVALVLVVARGYLVARADRDGHQWRRASVPAARAETPVLSAVPAPLEPPLIHGADNANDGWRVTEGRPYDAAVCP